MPISHSFCLFFLLICKYSLYIKALKALPAIYVANSLISLDLEPLQKARKICFYCPSGLSKCFCSNESSLQAAFYWQCFQKQKWRRWGFINLSLTQTNTWRTPQLSMARKLRPGSQEPQLCIPVLQPTARPQLIRPLGLEGLINPARPMAGLPHPFPHQATIISSI